MPHTLVLLRHGQSTWNLENLFTGWTDVDLTDQGRLEARRAGLALKEGGFGFDVAYTSLLKRAIRTLWIVLDEMDCMWIPVHRHWALNERHYGDLQGKNKAEAVATFGEAQVLAWRRSYDVPPPPLDQSDPRHPAHDRRYRGISPLPATESLATTLARVVPYFETVIRPRMMAGERVLVTAHGNSLRALVKHLDGLTESQVLSLNIPTGFPLVYELDDQFRSLGSRYLGDPAEVDAAISGVASQTKRP